MTMLPPAALQRLKETARGWPAQDVGHRRWAPTNNDTAVPFRDNIATYAAAGFFVYEPGVAVPRDATHALVHPSVEVLPEGAFRELRHLKEVVLPEGLRDIGWTAFRGCESLERVDFPSTLVDIGYRAFLCCASLTTLHFPSGLVRIDDDAFYDCTALTTLHFPTGLVEIGDNAFCGCSLVKRISLPPTVMTIGDRAFDGCSSLEVAILVDGIRTIGLCAFRGCALENIVLPATLTEIGIQAFGSCEWLKTVKLLGGIQRIEEYAFNACDLLTHIRITPKCLVVTEDGDNFDFNFAGDQTIVPHTDHNRVLITSECFHSMRSEEVSALETAISEILGTHRRRWADKHSRLRGLLAVHERRRKEEVTSILELGLWKAEMRRSEGCISSSRRQCPCCVRRPRETDPGTRAACRVTCKAGVIIPSVVPFL